MVNLLKTKPIARLLEAFKRPAAPVRKPSYEIGRTGTPDEYREELARLTPRANNYHMDARDGLKKLYNGALQAFHEQRPETVQAILADPGLRSLKSSMFYESPSVLSDVVRFRGAQQAPYAAVQLALEKTPEADKAAMLKTLLYEVLSDIGYQKILPSTQSESLSAALLAAGVKPGPVALALAISRAAPMSLVKRLVTNGARFDDALLHMQTHGWDETYITRLVIYRGQIAAGAALTEIQKQVQGLATTAAPQTPGKPAV